MSGPTRQKVDKMSGEVVDSNPYSRLMALQRMGIVKDYERIRSKTVGVVGREAGGVGREAGGIGYKTMVHCRGITT